MSDHKLSMEKRLEKHPALKDRIESLSDIVDNETDNIKNADDAERHVIDEIRQMGNEASHDRASGRESSVRMDLLANNEDMIGHVKKSAGIRHLGQ